MSMKVKLWGVRGSLPSPVKPSRTRERLVETLHKFDDYRKSNSDRQLSGQASEKSSKNSFEDIEKFVEGLPQHLSGGYGGNTACAEIQIFADMECQIQLTEEALPEKKHSIIIDGGSGIRELGESLLSGPCGQGKGRVDILFTHFHWDHVIGLPFFIPFFIPGNEIHCHAVSPGLEENIKRMFTKPNFPVPFDRLGAKVFFHQLEPRKTIELGDAQITPYQLDHPDPCWGYKVEHQGKTFSYCVDTEGTRVSREELGEDLPLYQNVDAMVFDAQYTFLEAAERVDWGHASSPIGLTLAMRESIKKVYFVHHDPASKDERMELLIKQTEEFYQQQINSEKKLKRNPSEVEWLFASEGMIIDF